jgi:serine/threonine-protein kinase
MSLTHLGRYEITGTLGRGAMGIVYQAHDPLIERTVAIKTVACAGLTSDETAEFEQRFFREAKSAGRLNHPNIVTIHDVGRSDDLAFIAMEFLAGRSLRDILDSGVVLPLERVAEIAAAIADGLAFAHANGVVHRDIKPANIMVLDSGIVKIADFGIALLPSGSLTMVGTSLGSPKYMSPEQVLGQKADGRSDIFSLGAVLYEMLTGRAPFAGDDLNAILYQVLNGAPSLPSRCNPRLPQAFDRIVARAMEKDPDKRYQHAAEVAADLRSDYRSPGPMEKIQSAGSALSAMAKPGTAGSSAGDATVLIATAAAPAKTPRLLRYGVPLAGLALFVGWFLLRPAAPPVPEKKVAEKPLEEARSVQKDAAEKKAGQATPESVAVSPATASKQPAAADWKTVLRAELAACDRESFFTRVVCSEKSRWKYCPGRWGSIKECTKAANG